MWVRSEFGVLVNLSQSSEITLSQGTVEAHFGSEARPLAHRSDESAGHKVFDLVAQCLADGKGFLDLSKRPGESAV